MISAFKALDLSKLTSEQITRRIEKIMHQYAVTPAELCFNGELYRARINKDKVDFTNKSELWYRTKNVEKISIGRFNKAGESLFYAAVELNTAIFELRPKEGDIMTVMELVPISSLGRITIIPTGLSKSISDKVLEGFNNERIARNILSNKDKKWFATDEFLESLLTEVVNDNEQYKYHATTTIATLLFKIPSIDGLYYPSIATSKKGLNLCLRLESADKILRPNKFFMIEIVEIIDDPQHGLLYGCRNIKNTSSIEKDGEIIW